MNLKTFGRLCLRGWIIALLIYMTPSVTSAQQIRMANYNLMGKPNSGADQAMLESILSAMGAEQVHGQAAAIDLMSFQEGPIDVAHFDLLESAFENVFGGDYQVIYSDLDSLNYRTGFIYNADVLELLDSTETGSFSGRHRQMAAKFNRVGGSPDDEFAIQSIQFPEGDTQTDIDLRDDRAFELEMPYQFALPFDASIIHLGNFALQGSTEPAYSRLTMFELIDTHELMDYAKPTGWSGVDSLMPFHTSEPSGAAGGMSQRPDWFLLSRYLYDFEGMDYVGGSATVFGNNATHTLGASITAGTGAAAVQAELIAFSDHLPLFADFTFGNVAQKRNVFFPNFVTQSYTIRPSGPRADNNARFYAAVEGDANGQFASFVVLDYDCTDAVSDKETLDNLYGPVEMLLAQSNASFSQSGPVRVYLCSEDATNVTIDNTIRYQFGNTDLDCVPSVLSTDALLVSTYSSIHRYPDGSIYPFNSSESSDLHGPEIRSRLLDAMQNDKTIRLLLVPLTDGAACTYTGFGTNTGTPPRLTVFGELTTVFNPHSIEFLEGLAWNGGLEQLADSDNVDLEARTAGVLRIELTGTSRVSFPDDRFAFRFEASVRSFRPVEQTIEFWDYDAQAYEVVDVRLSRQLGDLAIEIDAEGDTTRFVDFATRETKARITFSKLGLARGIRAMIDHAEWVAK